MLYSKNQSKNMVSFEGGIQYLFRCATCFGHLHRSSNIIKSLGVCLRIASVELRSIAGLLSRHRRFGKLEFFITGVGLDGSI